MDGVTNGRTRWHLSALSHLVNDMHSQFVAVFTPLLVARLGLSLGEAGMLTGLSGAMHVVVQPLSGFLSDMKGHNHFILGGMLASAFFSFLIPLAPDFPLALLFVFCWGLGTAFFHPQAQGASSYSAAPEDLSRAIALFSFGGMLGSSFSPLYGAFMYTLLPNWKLPLAGLVIPTVVAVAVSRAMPRVREPVATGRGLRDLPDKLVSIFRLIWPVWGVSFLRDTSTRSLVFLLPLLVAERGGNLADVGTVVFVLSFLQALCPMLLVRMVPGLRARSVLLVGLPMGAVLLYLGHRLPLRFGMIALIAAGVVLAANAPLTETLAQSLAPHDRSTSSSLTMGFSFGLASVMMTPAGFLAERFGIEAVFGLVALLPLAALAIVLFVWPHRGLR